MASSFEIIIVTRLMVPKDHVSDLDLFICFKYRSKDLHTDLNYYFYFPWVMILANKHHGTSFQAERLRHRRHICILGRMVVRRHGGILSLHVGHRRNHSVIDQNSCFMMGNLTISSRRHGSTVSRDGRRATLLQPFHLSQKLPRY